MSGVRIARVTVGLLTASALALAVTAVAAAVTSGHSMRDLIEQYALTNTVIGVSFAACGAVLAGARPRNPVGWLLFGAGLSHLVTAVLTSAAGWTTGDAAIWSLSIGILLPLMLQLFPTGRLLSPRWRIGAWCTVAAGALFCAAMASATASDPLWTVSNLAITLSYALTLASLVTRYRRGNDTQRRQLLWLVLAVVTVLLINAPRWVTGDGPILALLAIPLIPAAITIAVMRYGLLDIRLVLSRTLVYGLLTAAVLAAYAGLVAFLESQLRQAGAPALAALAVAIGFNPARLALQRVVDRALYGARRDPLRVMSNLGESLRSAGAGALRDVVGTVRSALRLPYAAIRIGPNVIAADGTPVDLLHAITLRYQAEEVGELIVGVRSGDRRLGVADGAVLDLVAVPLASAVHATELSRQLQASRHRIVAAREEERRRLHRDLHDGIGPTLTGVAFKADAAGNLSESDPAAARRLLAELRADVAEAIADIRRVVHGLRPPTLDELGLVGALRRQADGLPLTITVSAPDTIPPLPAAVEVAALRITIEALTNAARHANGRTACVGVRVDDALHLVVSDDGARRDPWPEGVGLTSIRERVAELGGTCECGPTQSGGRVSAVLPLDRGAP